MGLRCTPKLGIGVAMASDFFYPNIGGVEAHIWELSQRLVELDYRVIVVTHAYGDKNGIHYFPNNLKVYYLPYLFNDTLSQYNIKVPIVFNEFAYIRQILIREQVSIVHGHSAFSPIGHELMFHAKTLGINTVFTDHSLFGFNYRGAATHKQFVKLSLLQCNHIICVSKAGKENEALQIKVDANRNVPVSVIPNAVDTFVFRPDPTQRDPCKITIVVNSRLVYRKGVGLLAKVLPEICHLNDKIHFIIVGAGPKRPLLDEAVSQHQLSDRVQFFGSVPHDQVRDILVKGDIFLNTSLVEAFCMAIVEAASCGLQVVSTNVGGLPEVLPPNLIILTEPNVDGLLKGVKIALDDLFNKKFVPPLEAHNIIKKSYSWHDVARKTDRVYKLVMQDKPLTLKDRLKLYMNGPSLGFLFIIFIFINNLLLLFFNWLHPEKDIEICSVNREENLKENESHTNLQE